MRISLLLAVILTSSCTQYIVKPLPMPPPIERPTEGDLECLSDNAYELIVGMDKRIETLLGIIRSTHE